MLIRRCRAQVTVGGQAADELQVHGLSVAAVATALLPAAGNAPDGEPYRCPIWHLHRADGRQLTGPARPPELADRGAGGESQALVRLLRGRPAKPHV